MINPNTKFEVSTFIHYEHKKGNTKCRTRDYFDATASNWNTYAHRAPGESLCIKTGNQIGGWVYSRFDHVIHGGQKYTNFLASGRGMSVD